MKGRKLLAAYYLGMLPPLLLIAFFGLNKLGADLVQLALIVALMGSPIIGLCFVYLEGRDEEKKNG